MAALRGFGAALNNSSVWGAYARLVGALIIASLVVGAAMGYGVWLGTGLIPDSGWYWSLAMWSLRLVGFVLVFFSAPLLALFVVNIVFPLFAEAVFFAGMRRIAPGRAEAMEALPGLPVATAVWVAIRVFIHFMALTVLALLVSLIPVIGTVGGPVFQIWITAKTLGWELIDPLLDKRSLRFSGQRDYVNQNSMAITGFALPFSLLLAIPIIGPLFFGLAQAAAPALVVDILEPDGGRS